MKINRLLIALAVLATAACATNRPANELLTQAKSTYQAAQASSGIQNTSAREMDAAKDALRKAEQLHEDNANEQLVDHYAIVALKNSEIAQERLQLKQTRRNIDEANERRQQLLLQARAQEAQSAKEKLQSVRSEAESAKAEAMQLAAELDEIKAEQNERGIILTLGDIVFAFDSAELQPGGERILQRIADYLQQYPKRKLLVEGYTDSVGSEEYNLKLSEQRAKAVQQALMKHGIDQERIQTKGHGEAYPVASNESDAGRQQNRRVEVVIGNKDDTRVSKRR